MNRWVSGPNRETLNLVPKGVVGSNPTLFASSRIVVNGQMGEWPKPRDF